MGEERQRILMLVAEGKLTIEQAEELLDALEHPRPRVATARPTMPPEPPQPPVPPVPPAPPAYAFSFSTPGGRTTRVRTAKRKGGMDFDALIQLALHDLSPSLMKELRDAGLKDLTVDQMIQLGIHDVSPSMVRELFDMGFEALDVEDIVQLAIHDVSPSFIRELREEGLELSIDEIVRCAIHGVSMAQVRAWREAGALGREDADDASADDDEPDPEAQR